MQYIQYTTYIHTYIHTHIHLDNTYQYHEGTTGMFFTVTFLRKKEEPTSIKVIRSKRTTQEMVIPITTESACGSMTHTQE